MVNFYEDEPTAHEEPDVNIHSLSSAHQKLDAPSTDGGSRITHYCIEYRMQGFFHWREESTTSAALSYTVQGLSKNCSYTFRVKALNAAGESPPSDECNPIKIEIAEGELSMAAATTLISTVYLSQKSQALS